MKHRAMTSLILSGKVAYEEILVYKRIFSSILQNIKEKREKIRGFDKKLYIYLVRKYENLDKEVSLAQKYAEKNYVWVIKRLNIPHICFMSILPAPRILEDGIYTIESLLGGVIPDDDFYNRVCEYLNDLQDNIPEVAYRYKVRAYIKEMEVRLSLGFTSIVSTEGNVVFNYTPTIFWDPPEIIDIMKKFLGIDKIFTIERSEFPRRLPQYSTILARVSEDFVKKVAEKLWDLRVALHPYYRRLKNSGKARISEMIKEYVQAMFSRGIFLLYMPEIRDNLLHLCVFTGGTLSFFTLISTEYLRKKMQKEGFYSFINMKKLEDYEREEIVESINEVLDLIFKRWSDIKKKVLNGRMETFFRSYRRSVKSAMYNLVDVLISKEGVCKNYQGPLYYYIRALIVPEILAVSERVGKILEDSGHDIIPLVCSSGNL